MLNLYKEKPYLIDQAITTLELSFQELFDSPLYTAYLARAAETADYVISREEMDERYLGEVRDHRSEMIEFMKIMAEVESEARKELQKETGKEKSNDS